VSDAAAISLVTEQGGRWVRLDLQDGSPRRPQIASDLGLSDHTFQRRLSDEGTSFIELVDETRRELAHRQLSDPQTSLSEIVYLLGYSDLFRAYLRWFGRSPGEHRTSRALDLADRASRVGA
jgi:AraC-like DNA-binding protein